MRNWPESVGFDWHRIRRLVTTRVALDAQASVPTSFFQAQDKIHVAFEQQCRQLATRNRCNFTTTKPRLAPSAPARIDGTAGRKKARARRALSNVRRCAGCADLKSMWALPPRLEPARRASRLRTRWSRSVGTAAPGGSSCRRIRSSSSRRASRWSERPGNCWRSGRPRHR